MSSDFIVFTKEPAEFIKENDSVNVNNIYDFDDIYGAHVYTDDPFELQRDYRVLELHENFQANVALAPESEQESKDEINRMSSGPVTMDDIYNIHNIPNNHNGNDVTVVIMDSGVDVDHPVFDNAKFIDQVDVTGSGTGDSGGHGTATAGLVHQIAPEVKLISLKIFDGHGGAPMHVIMKAYEWLLNNTDRYDIVNMSWGSGGQVDSIDKIHQKMLDNDVLDCIASGNTGNKGGSPGTCINAFSVGAIQENQEMASFSSYNPTLENPDVSALGKNVVLPGAENGSMGQPYNDNYVIASGTSFSAPIVSGLLACSLEHFDSYKNKISQLQRHYERNARNIPNTPRDGHGIVDFNQVHQALKQS
jgi:subtilisin family serine protease